MRIRFCGNNAGAEKVYKRLQADFPEADIAREKCLKNCAVCNCSLFAMVDEAPLRARNGNELYGKIAALYQQAA